ncbi:hypothetical protein ACFQZS_01440 [Mucilaginibacter calamicampi]|uniref:Uncharacterized protein n=1 Tax=Mucilaginibacter calamicampi TaxID=1302352 RepID=A0ABW2YS37_9SPHI
MKKLQLLLFAIIAFAYANAQKLPNVQQASLRAPANVKIDGKATEWGGKFQAYNPATDIFYTIANDDKKLYLVFKATDRYNITRIVSGGLKINIQKNGSKNDSGSPGIQFPYMEKGKRISFIQRLDLQGATGEKKNHMLDSAMQANNIKLRTNVKQIYTNAIPGVDTVLSIYNDKGIEVANAFDVDKVYTAELAVDLKLFGLSAANASKFTYHISIKGGANKYAMGISFGMATNNDGTPAEAFTKQLNDYVEQQAATTDFWGEYTLAK